MKLLTFVTEVAALLFTSEALPTGSWSGAVSASCYVEENGKIVIQDGSDHEAEVTGTFLDGMASTGWGQLEVRVTAKAGEEVTDAQRAYCAGAVEGYLTGFRIYQTYMNTREIDGLWNFTGGAPQELQNFMATQSSYMNEQIEKNGEDEFWAYANLVKNQLAGLEYGYNYAASESGGSFPVMSSWPFEFLNMVGDLLDLMTALNITTALDWRDYTGSEEKKREFHHKLLARGRCSGLIKVSPLMDDLMIAHSSWFVFQNTNRIYKHYIFKFQKVQTAAIHMSFSSYPGYLESLDDFYLMDSGLAMVQTTNSVPDTSQYSKVTPYSLYAWQRVRIANALSRTGVQWYDALARENSGTYNNQYMVLNYHMFTPNEPIPSSQFLTIIEQMPGLVAMMDASEILERGYWGSYNVPAIEEIYNKSGYPAMVKAMGAAESYDLAPRARIFRRDANSISDYGQFKAFMRYNDYQKDPIENNDPWWAICSRGDLAASGAYPNGCYDTKVANYSMILAMTAEVINGPTSDDLPPFSWNDWPGIPHAGIEQTMDYPWTYQYATSQGPH